MKRQTLSAALCALLAIAVASGALWIVNPRRTRTGIVQDRGTGTTAVLHSGVTLSQTFTSRENGLQAIALKPAIDGTALPAGTRVRLVLEPLEGASDEAIRMALSPEHLAPDGTLVFRFAPLEGSASTRYQLTLSCATECDLGLIASEQDSLAEGELTENGVVGGDLWLTTYYAQSFRDLVTALPGILSRWRPSLLAVLLLLFAPGLAGTLLLLDGRHNSPVAAIGLALALSMAFWPLLLLWTGTLHLALTSSWAWAIAAGSVLISVATCMRRGRKSMRSRLAPWDAPQTTLVIITLLAVLLRLIQARQLLVPAWVDSVHHTMLTSLIVEGGVVPVSGAPYMEADALHYHFGFHALAAVLSWLTGLRPDQSVLLVGQVLSGLAGLPLYGLVSTLAPASKGRPSLAWRWAGVIAAAVPAFLTYMPAYYVSWGRYTQLAGLVMLPPLVALSLQLVTSPRHKRPALTLAFLAAGLALTHYRVLFYYTLLWPALAVLSAAGGLGPWRGLRAMLNTAWQAVRGAALTLILVGPWALHLVRTALIPRADLYGSWVAPPGIDTGFPAALARSGNTEWILALAGVGLIYAILRRRWTLALIGLWSGLCLLVSDPGLVGLPGSWFVHGTSAFISYWLPAGVLVGTLIADLSLLPAARLPNRTARFAIRIVPLVLVMALAAGATLALWYQADVVNSKTVLLQKTDMPAIAWAREHLPEDSLTLVNTEPWQAGMPMGSDAGWWLPYLAGRMVTFPSVLVSQGSAEYRTKTMDLADALMQAQDLTSPAFIASLADAGVTHLFVGARGGPLQPERLDDPHYVELYRFGPTRIYRLEPDTH